MFIFYYGILLLLLLLLVNILLNSCFFFYIFIVVCYVCLSLKVFIKKKKINKKNIKKKCFPFLGEKKKENIYLSYTNIFSTVSTVSRFIC